MEKGCHNCNHHFMNHKRCTAMYTCHDGSAWTPEVTYTIGTGASIPADGQYHTLAFTINDPNMIPAVDPVTKIVIPNTFVIKENK